MFSHPLLEALFNENASTPSKQLLQARLRLSQSGDKPCFLIILPPESVIAELVSLETLFQDNFLLSHVLDVSNLKESSFATLNGANWKLEIKSNKVVPQQGFPPQRSQTVEIISQLLWRPGLRQMNYNATFMVVNVNNLLLLNDNSRKTNWFGPSRSIPSNLPEMSPEIPIVASVVQKSPDIVPSARKQVKNPAFGLEIGTESIERASAKVDYCIACLQLNAVSSQQLANRFHLTVQNIKNTLEEFGGVFDDSDEEYTGAKAGNTFTLAEIYDYAEAKLGRTLLKQLEVLLEAERKEDTFFSIYGGITHLDISQVDIPGLGGLCVSSFEQATAEAALVLGHLSETTLSTEMCRTFLKAMSFLVDPKLGTVSADTLLGLFMLTILRTSPDAVQVLERNVYYVTNFSFQASNNILARASAGRLSYTLMVVESVMLHVRSERERLGHLSEWNAKMWQAVRASDKLGIEKVGRECPSSLTSRRCGKSALFMALEDQNVEILKFLLTKFRNKFTKEFVLQDRDANFRTLLTASLIVGGDNVVMLEYIMETVGENTDYFCQQDKDLRHIGFHVNSEKQVDFVLSYMNSLEWNAKDKDGNTPILHIAKYLPHLLSRMLRQVTNFYDHIDRDGNSLLHVAGNDPILVKQVLGIPGCNVNWVNNMGMSAVMVSKNTEVCEILLENGADPWLQGKILPTTGNSSVCLARAAVMGSKALYVGNKAESDVKTVLLSQESLLECPVDKFIELNSLLLSSFPTSWVPGFNCYYSDLHAERGCLGELFARDLTLEDNIRLSCWLNQLNWHATISSSSELQGFFHPHLESNQSNEALTSSLFGSEDEDSRLMFLRLGSERLENVHSVLAEYAKEQCRLNSVDAELLPVVRRCERSLAYHSALVETILPGSTEFKPLHNTAAVSSTEKVLVLSLMELSRYALSLQERMNQSLELATRLNQTREVLSQERNHLASLAAAKPKPAWLSSLENKRLGEIKQVEHSVTNNRKLVTEMEVELRATHYCLANELGTFNNCQEEELLENIRAFSLHNLQKVKDAMGVLKLGYQPKIK